MPNSDKIDSDLPDRISRLIGRRAGNIFLTHQLWCSGAALMAINQGLGGDLTQDQVIRLAAGLGDGLGGSGCLCGGINGAALALGLFLGHGHISTDGNRAVLDATRELHDKFKTVFGSTCCRILTKKQKTGSREHFQLCAHRTSVAAGKAAQLILKRKPELAGQADWEFLNLKENKIGKGMKKIANYFSKR